MVHVTRQKKRLLFFPSLIFHLQMPDWSQAKARPGQDQTLVQDVRRLRQAKKFLSGASTCKCMREACAIPKQSVCWSIIRECCQPDCSVRTKRDKPRNDCRLTKISVLLVVRLFFPWGFTRRSGGLNILPSKTLGSLEERKEGQWSLIPRKSHQTKVFETTTLLLVEGSHHAGTNPAHPGQSLSVMLE
jgi:hypothetical protein